MARVAKLFGFHGIERVDINVANAGDIIAITGLDELHISDYDL